MPSQVSTTKSLNQVLAQFHERFERYRRAQVGYLCDYFEGDELPREKARTGTWLRLEPANETELNAWIRYSYSGGEVVNDTSSLYPLCLQPRTHYDPHNVLPDSVWYQLSQTGRCYFSGALALMLQSLIQSTDGVTLDDSDGISSLILSGF